MANVWFVGDLHAGHEKVHNFRNQFNSEQEHFEQMAENYHKVVGKRDKVFFMGDTVFTHERLKQVASWAGDSKVLILGNHDTDKIGIRTLGWHFDEVYAYLKYKEFWLSHFPIHPEELRGRKNIHGHVHSATVPDTRYFNTSLENTNYCPIDLNTIRKRMEVV